MPLLGHNELMNGALVFGIPHPVLYWMAAMYWLVSVVIYYVWLVVWGMMTPSFLVMRQTCLWCIFTDLLTGKHTLTLRPRQNGHRFADNIFKCILLNENVWISINILAILNLYIFIQENAFENVVWKWRPFCLGLNELICRGTWNEISTEARWDYFTNRAWRNCQWVEDMDTKLHLHKTTRCNYKDMLKSTCGVAPLTHWGRDKMATISQTTLSNAFSWMKIYKFWLRFHLSLFQRVQLTIFQPWFR